MMAYTVFSKDDSYKARKGLEGPFHYPNGRVLYYDPIAGAYWDPRTDFFLQKEEIDELHMTVAQWIAKSTIA